MKQTTKKTRSNGSTIMAVSPFRAAALTPPTLGVIMDANNLPPGSTITLTDEDAAEAFRLNREVVRAQEALKAVHNTLMTFAQATAPRYGISLDPALGRWNFDPGTGIFTRLADTAPTPEQG